MIDKNCTRPIDTAGAADYSGLAISTLEKMRVSGDGPTYIKVGRRVLYFPEDIENWLKSHRRAHTSCEG